MVRDLIIGLVIKLSDYVYEASSARAKQKLIVFAAEVRNLILGIVNVLLLKSKNNN